MRGAWIEIVLMVKAIFIILSLPMRGAWIEIISASAATIKQFSRSPCGERGLKLKHMMEL